MLASLLCMHVCTDSLPPGSQCKASDCAIEPALTCMHLHGKPMQHNQHRITSYLASVTSNLHRLVQEPCAASPEQQTTTSRGKQHKTDSKLPGGPSKRLAQSTIKCLTLKLNQPEASELTCHCPQEALYVHVYMVYLCLYPSQRVSKWLSDRLTAPEDPASVMSCRGLLPSWACMR